MSEPSLREVETWSSFHFEYKTFLDEVRMLNCSNIQVVHGQNKAKSISQPQENILGENGNSGPHQIVGEHGHIRKMRDVGD